MKKHLLFLATLVLGLGQLFADEVTFSVSDLKASLPASNTNIDLPYVWKASPYHVTATIARQDDLEGSIGVSTVIPLSNAHKITISVAGEGKLNSIKITTNPTNQYNNATASTGEFSKGQWTPDGDTKEVTFSCTNNFRITQIAVDYTPDENVTPVVPVVNDDPIIPVTTESINTYTGTDPFVLDLSDGKVYARNNLGEYERYGVYSKVGNVNVATSSATEIEYIKAQKNTYINLNYIPKANTRAVAVIDAETGGDWKAIYGCGYFENGWKDRFCFFTTNATINLGGETSNRDAMRYNEKIVTVLDAAAGKMDIFKADGTTLIGTITDSPKTADCKTPLYVFAQNKDVPGGGKQTDCYNMLTKLYSLKLYEGETLVMDLVPVVTAAEGKGGLKDKLTNKIYTSANEDDFELSSDASNAPISAYEGKIVYNTTDGFVYKYNGSNWENVGARTLTPIAGEDYKNMKNWNCPDGHWADVFGSGDNIGWNETTLTNTFDPYVGTGGWEPLRYKFNAEADADYNISFNYSTGGWKTWSNNGDGGGEVDKPVTMPFKIIDREAIEQNNGHFGTDAGWINGARLTPEAQEGTPVSVDFNTPTGIATFIMQFGVVDDGTHDPAYWFKFDNILIQKYNYPETYRIANPYGDLLDALIAEVEGATLNTTTDLQTALDAALATAKTAAELSGVELEEIFAQKNALEALQAAYDAAKAVDVTILAATAALAKAEGINTDDADAFLANGTDNGVKDKLIRILRAERKLNAAQQFKVDADKVQGSEPANGEYYLLNVGTGLFLNTTADWGTHISIDNPGMLIKLVQDGTGNDGLPAFKISGNGWEGLNWSEEYWDKNGEHKSAFRPVEGKENVYYWNVFDNFGWHFVYDVTDGECDGGTQHWNAVQKRNKPTADYAADLNAQWKLVTKAQLLAAISEATEGAPVDATFLINNPNFIKNGGQDIARGWEGVGDVKSGDRDYFYVIEYYQRDVNLKQTIEGLPAGKYQVSVSGFYRDGGSDYEAAKVGNGEDLVDNAFLVAYTDDAKKVSTALPHPTDEAGKLPGIGDTRDGVEGAFANWPWQANEYFQTGLYKATTDVIEVGQDGKLTIGVESSYNGVGGSWVVVDNFRLTCLGVAGQDVTVGDALYATYVAPVDVDFTGAEVSAFAAQTKESYVHLEPVTTVPAGTAVVVKADAAGTYKVAATADAVLGTTNNLIAATADVTADGTQYILAKQGEAVGFAPATPTTTIVAGKGYLVISAPVKPFYPFGEDDATSINNIEFAGENAPIYNVAGQRIGKMQKGINIVGGKKVLK